MDAITEQEKKDIQGFLATIYGNQALKWNVNIRVLELFGELLKASDSCSRYMDMIPRSYYAGNAIKWVSKQARQAVIRHLKNSGEHYLLCLRGVGVKHKSAIYMASLGL